MDLLRLWKCTSQSSVSLYRQALSQLDAGGASAQEMVSYMQKVAHFFHLAGELEAAENTLVGGSFAFHGICVCSYCSLQISLAVVPLG